ncbi:MAG: universal stress protein [Verrucomicrobia bacterium]|nr:universal stress protein [Verrucomicrobiota bacterium]
MKKPSAIRAFAGTANDFGSASQEGATTPRPESLQFTRILLPTDFSDASRKALKYATRFVEQFGSRVTLIHVIEPVMSPDFKTFPLALDEEKVVENVRNRLLALARSHFHERQIEGVVVRTGNPFHEISEAARELNIDLIIISTHGYTGVKRALLGSTAERVVRHSQCPVMTVR